MDNEKLKTYNKDFLVEKYNHKKVECKRRLIPFEFSLEEWLEFHKILYSGVKCAYLNQEFIFQPSHKLYPTIERLYDNQPYSVLNCVWVSRLANTIKDKVVKGKSSEDFEIGEKNFAKRIEKIVANKSLIEIIQEPYQHLFNKEIQGESMTSKVESTTPVNQEILSTRLYSDFGNFIEQVCGAEFELTYSQYKQTLVNRKNCQLTGRKLPDDLAERRLWVMDKTIAVGKNNVLVCDKTLSEALDTLVVSAKLSFKDLQKIAKVLGK